MKNKSHDYSGVIIWAALAVTVARYIGAFVASDVGKLTGWVSDLLTILMAFSGVGMGFLDVLGLAYVFDGWRAALPATGKRPSTRFWMLTGFVVGLFVVGLGILTPFTVARINMQGMSDTLGEGSWLWALAVNLAPILLIGGVTFSQRGFVTVNHDASTSVHDASMVQASKNERLHTCKKCGASFRNLPELASHSRWSHPKSIVTQSEIMERSAAQVSNNHNGRHA